MALREFITHPLVLRRLEVLRVRDVTPRMRRVTVGGDQLEAFERDGLSLAGFAAPGFDDHIKLVFATEGDIADALPVQLADGIEWTPAPGRQARDYTPRRFADGELDLDFVLHGAGPAVEWARAAAPGDDVWIVGPKSSIVLPEAPDWIALIGDETALPAIGRFLDERPLDVPAHVVVTIGAASARQDLALRENDTIDWVVAPPTDRDALDAAVRRAVPEGGDGFVWAAAESRTLLPVRRFLAKERRLAKNRMNITGYWHADDEADAPQHPEVASPLAWFVVRAALQSGLLDDLADRGAAPIADVAARLRIAAAALSPLLPILAEHGIVALADGILSLGPAGEELLTDEHEREEFDGLEADLMLSLSELAPALLGGTTPWARAHGETMAAAAAEGELFDELAHESDVLRFVGAALMRDALWQGVDRALVTGPGAAEVADLASEAEVDARFLVTGDGARSLQGEALLADDGKPADVLVAAFALAHRTDAEARELLNALRERSDLLIVVEAVRADSLGGAEYERAMLALAANGVGLREVEALADLGRSSGWAYERTIALGWGNEAVVFRGV